MKKRNLWRNIIIILFVFFYITLKYTDALDFVEKIPDPTIRNFIKLSLIVLLLFFIISIPVMFAFDLYQDWKKSYEAAKRELSDTIKKVDGK